MIETDTNELQAEIRADVEAERLAAWKEAQAKHNTEKAKKLTDEPKPPPEHMPWTAERVVERRGPRVERLRQACWREQLGDAELLIDRVGDRYTFDHKRKQWYRNVGTHWVEDGVNQIRAEVVALAEHFDRAAFEARKTKKSAAKKSESAEKKKEEAEEQENEEAAKKADQEIKEASEEATTCSKDAKLFSDRAKKLRGDRRIAGILNMATSGADSMGISGDDSTWDRHPTLLACPNGVIDLETGKLYKGEPKHYIRKASPFNFPGLHAYSASWHDTFGKIMCWDPVMMDYVERVVGYAATGLVSHKEFYVAKGPTANNGKSTFFDAIQMALGDAAGTIKKEVLLQKKNQGSGADPDLLMLDGLRMAIASEPEQGSKFDKEVIKMVTGGDRITTRGLYMDNITFMAISKLFIHANFTPQVAKADQAFFNRMRIIPFDAQFVGNPDEVDLARHIYPGIPRTTIDRQLQKDGPAILAWIVRCARKYLADETLKYPLKVAEEIEQYQDDMDEIGRWVAEWCLVDKHNETYKTKAKDLYDSFKLYCRNVLEKAEAFIPTQRTFGEQLQQRFEKKKTNYVYYFGIKVKAGCSAAEQTQP
ncbi:DNA primase family protein [Desulfoluna butyratoxydans]|uniref:Dna primase phage/plasmid n=1 Tax=Desulfoluna butyratoxydans TaxID=231438 RepID=A0A4U8YKJ9_9BACT|nr:phage/plasmid primase, P4 family [Desulfoluna butyratoxydans]VFQ44405.1 dna primase phage/plasmid [Desulfoluna butyratoxydans]